MCHWGYIILYDKIPPVWPCLHRKWSRDINRMALGIYHIYIYAPHFQSMWDWQISIKVSRTWPNHFHCGDDSRRIRRIRQVLTFLLNFIPEIGAARLAVRCRWRLKWQAGRSKKSREMLAMAGFADHSYSSEKPDLATFRWFGSPQHRWIRISPVWPKSPVSV